MPQVNESSWMILTMSLFLTLFFTGFVIHSYAPIMFFRYSHFFPSSFMIIL